MTDEPNTAPPSLTDHLASVQQGFDALEGVLETLFQAYEKQGVRPTYHLTAALEKMREGISEAQIGSQQAQRQLDHFREIARTAALISSSLEFNTVLDEVMDTVIQLTGAERSYLMLYDDSHVLQMRAARNWDRQRINQQDALFSQGIVDTAVRQGVPIITTNAQADERFQERASIVIQQLRSIICIPLTIRGQTVGVLYADNRYRQDVFAEDLIPVLTAFGNQAAIAITNARLFGEVKSDLAQAKAEIDRLRIEIDQKRLDTQVDEIVTTEYFQKLHETARAKREERQTGERKAVGPDEVKRAKPKKK